MTQFTSPETGTRNYIVDKAPLKMNVYCPMWDSRFSKHGW